MKLRDFAFCIMVLLSVFLFRKILYILPFIEINEYSFDKIIADIVLCIIIIAVSIFGLKRMQFSYIYKFKRPAFNEVLVLFLPLVFPGMIVIEGFSFSCYQPFFYGALFILAILLKGIFEEVIFRGIIQGFLLKQYPQATYNKICIITALFFSLAHLTNLQYGDIQNVLHQVIYAFYLGLLFSAIFLKTKNIWLLGIVHGILNFFAKRCDYSTDLKEQSEILQNASFDFMSLLGVVIIFSPILLIYYLLVKSLGKRKSV